MFCKSNNSHIFLTEKPGYFLGFFFWLDIISTLSLIFDIGWISDAIFDTNSGASGAASAAQLARAGRASRVGARAGRIVRIIRLVRLIRIVKLYKAAQTTLVKAHPGMLEDGLSNGPKRTAGGSLILNSEDHVRFGDLGSGARQIKESVELSHRLNSENGEPRESRSRKQSTDNLERKANSSKSGSLDNLDEKRSVSGVVQDNKDKKNTSNIEIPKETNVGRKLSDLTTRRVITLVMSVMLSIPVFNSDTYLNNYSSGESGLKTLYKTYEIGLSTGDMDAYTIANQTYVENHYNLRVPLWLLVINKNNVKEVLWPLPGNIPDEYSLRDNEKQYFNIPNKAEGADPNIPVAYAVFDQRANTRLNAILGIIRTLFVTIILAAGALLFSKDANDLVLSPIEMMLTKVRRIAANPLEAAQIEESEELALEELEKQGKLKDLKKRKEEGNYETAILEKTILKLGALLALGFGEAGSEIIAQNMAKSGEVDPMIPGKKVMAIFGFCDIRNFTDATEVLQEGVMVFVNEIAEIVHGTINHFSGAANKNIGDAFLLVWKFPPDEVETDPDDPSNLRIKPSRIVQQTADMSILSFLKIIALINKSKKLEKYRHNAGLNERLPNYSVKMGFGLHVGWAIEGAIGSEYKIDASYLSPNVNMASRLEAATKQYGVPILISGALYKIASSETKKQLRLIDKVTVKGSVQPIELYTCDLDWSKLPINTRELNFSALTPIEKKKVRVISRAKRDELKERAYTGKTKLGKLFYTDKDIALMREPFHSEFYQAFQEGMENYLNGNWEKAKVIFSNTLTMIPDHKDGPSNTLLEVIEAEGGKAPADWEGYRVLTEK